MAGLLADALLVLHVGVVLFAVIGELLFLLGGVRRWRWVRHLGLRVLHLALVGFVAVQSWLGQVCPLTEWEHALRGARAAPLPETGFIQHWLSRLLYLQAPAWVFVAAYTGFAVLVLATWWWVPPRRRGR